MLACEVNGVISLLSTNNLNIIWSISLTNRNSNIFSKPLHAKSVNKIFVTDSIGNVTILDAINGMILQTIDIGTNCKLGNPVLIDAKNLLTMKGASKELNKTDSVKNCNKTVLSSEVRNSRTHCAVVFCCSNGVIYLIELADDLSRFHEIHDLKIEVFAPLNLCRNSTLIIGGHDDKLHCLKLI